LPIGEEKITGALSDFVAGLLAALLVAFRFSMDAWAAG
jgi:hypothetical protein